MNNLCDDINLHIIEYLDNETIFDLACVNKYFNSITTNDDFIEYLQYRQHPMVFNSIDNFCTKCNIGIIIINDDNELCILRCHHPFNL